MFELRLGTSQICSYKDLLQWSGDIMVQAARRSPGLHRVLYTHWYVVRSHTPTANTTIIFALTVKPGIKEKTAKSILFVLYFALFPLFCAGGWAVSSMKWSLADLSSLDRLWRMSSTSYSVSLVRPHQWNVFLCVLRTARQVVNCNSPFSSTGTPTEETWPGITTSEEFKTYNFPQYQAEPLVNHAPRYAVVLNLSFKLYMKSNQIGIDFQLEPQYSLYFLFTPCVLLLLLTQDRQRWSWITVNASAGTECTE